MSDKDFSFSRDFRGIWIPANIWLDEELSMMEKTVLAEIESLGGASKGCWATNSYLANFFGIENRSIQRIISTLKRTGYIKIFEARNPDGKSKRTIWLTSKGRENCNRPAQINPDGKTVWVDVTDAYTANGKDASKEAVVDDINSALKTGGVTQMSQENHEGVTEMSWGGDSNVTQITDLITVKDIKPLMSEMNSDESIPTEVDKNLPALAEKPRKTKSDAEKLKTLFANHPEAEGGIYSPSGNKWGSADDLYVAQYLFEHCKRQYPNTKEPKWVEWANEIRLIRVQDGKPHAEMLDVIDWVTQDDFWNTNILSPKSLRKSFNKLAAKALSWMKRRQVQNQSWLNDQNALRGSMELHDQKMIDDINNGVYAGVGPKYGDSVPHTFDYIDAEYTREIDPPF